MWHQLSVSSAYLLVTLFIEEYENFVNFVLNSRQ